MEFGPCILGSNKRDAFQKVFFDVGVKLFKRSTLHQTAHNAFGFCWIRQAQVALRRGFIVSLAENSAQLKHGEGSAKQRFAQLCIVIVGVVHALDVRNGLVGRGHSRVVGLPKLIRRFGIAHLLDVFPLVSLLLKPVERAPRAVHLLVGIVRIHLGKVGRMCRRVGANQELANF